MKIIIGKIGIYKKKEICNIFPKYWFNEFRKYISKTIIITIGIKKQRYWKKISFFIKSILKILIDMIK